MDLGQSPAQSSFEKNSSSDLSEELQIQLRWNLNQAY